MEYCNECGKRFSAMKSLDRHIKEIHNDPEFPCGTCGKAFRRSDALTIHKAAGNCIQMNRFNHEQPKPELLHEKNPVTSPEEESVEWKQSGAGHHQKSDPMETDSNEDMESEAESDREDDRKSVDVFDHDSDSGSPENSSSEDSHDCESSSDNSSGDEDPDEDDNSTIPIEGVAHDGSVETVDDAEDEDEASQEHQPEYINFARWRNSDCGLYSAWSSRKRKPHVVQHHDWLRKILATPDKLMKPLINEASNSQLEAFREIAANVLKGHAVMRPQLFNIMRKNKCLIRTLASEDSSYDQLRRTLLVAREFVVPLLVFFATPTCIKSEKAAFNKLTDE